MSRADALLRLVSRAVCTAAEAPVRVPGGPGYYAIFIDAPKHLPDPFDRLLLQRATTLIYIGIATRSLTTRLVKQDLRHERPSTFFRAIRSILGFRPPRGSLVGKPNQSNYLFSAADTGAIVRWIDTHLSVNWAEAIPAVKSTEASLILEYRPILNTKHNREPVAELASLRDECRKLARTHDGAPST